MNNRKFSFKSFKDNKYTIIISRLLTCLFSLFVMIMATLSFAWMTQSKDVAGGNMQLKLEKPDDIITSVTVHPCIGKDADGVYYFDKENASINNLKKFMLLVPNNRQLLVHIHFEDPETVWGISLAAKTNTSFFMGDGQHPLLATADGKGVDYDNVLSSIISFYVVDSQDTTYDSKSAYQVNTIGTPYNFINKIDYSLTNTLTLVDKQMVSDLYIVLDYDVDLVSKVFSENLGNMSFERPDGSFMDEVFYNWDIEFQLTQG